jgi:nickel-dependent lactate racemase
MLYFGSGSETHELTDSDLKQGLETALTQLGQKQKVIVIPPDITRLHSFSGQLTRFAWEYYREKLTDIMPALGTHVPMSEDEITRMYSGVPVDLFREHDWRNDVVTVGRAPASFISELSEGKLDFEWPVQLNRLLLEGGFDLILSIGQVVPHEVVGMANHSKNILIGTGGAETINSSHYLGAVFGMERMMGRAETPVRKVLNYACENFINHLPIIYVQTVVGKDKITGDLKVRGLYIGDYEAFEKASELSLKVNFELLDKPLKKVVVYLPPDEFRTTWLGNKSIYRTRMAIADQGELIVMAPGLKNFGEDEQIDTLIRKYGYKTTPEILKFVQENEDLQNNLSAAAHLIHGSAEDRFRITYCPGQITKAEIESVNYDFGDLKRMMKRYNPAELKDGYNTMVDGEEIFYISNPALGLWANRGRFTNN